jgi:hypothetical protein
MLWNDQRGRSDTPCGFGQRPAGRTPSLRRAIWNCWGFETATVIELAIGPGGNVASGRQTGREQYASNQGQHELHAHSAGRR